MILNTNRLFLFFVFILTIFFLSACVDIPSSGPPVPDYHASVKYLHFGRGSDTIAFVLSKYSYVKVDSVKSSVVVGADNVNTTQYVTTKVTIDRYNRYLVDFGQTLNLLVDGASKGSLNQGESTTYFDTPAGGRKIELKGDGTYVDSISVYKIDSTIVFKVDTVKPNGDVKKGGRDTTFQSKIINIVPVTNVTQQITVDSTVVTAETDRQLSLFFIGDSVASTIRDDRARYGLIKFTTSIERYLFSPVPSDSALVRIAHVSPKTHNINVKIGTSSANIVTGLTFTSLSQNRFYNTKVDPVYNFIFDTSGIVIDSVSVTLSKGKQYTIALLESGGTRTIKAIQH